MKVKKIPQDVLRLLDSKAKDDILLGLEMLKGFRKEQTWKKYKNKALINFAGGDLLFIDNKHLKSLGLRSPIFIMSTKTRDNYDWLINLKYK